MRDKFADVIYNSAKKDEKICVLVADISPAGSIEKFRKQFPDRFINCGVAEQSMIGIAAGLALKGFKPFCYTIATFALFRPFEFIRVDLCYQNLPVTIVGMGAGTVYSTLGSTHHSIEDVAISTAIPNMQVISPCDPLEMKFATEWCVKKNKGPVYMRLGKKGETTFTENAYEKFEFGKIRFINLGKDVAIITYGTIISIAYEVYKNLKMKGLNPALISCHTIKPLDYSGIKKILSRFKFIFIIEEHVPNGSLSNKIKEIAYDNHKKTIIKSFNLKDKFIHFYGSHKDFLSKHNLGVDYIKNEIIKLLEK